MKIVKAKTLMDLARIRISESRHYRNVSEISFITQEDPTNSDHFYFSFESNLPINDKDHHHDGEIAEMSFCYDIPDRQFLFSFDNSGYTQDIENWEMIESLITDDEELF